MKNAMIAGGFTAALLAGAAFAGDYAEKFAEMDSDGDTIVTEAEFTAYKTADGETTAEEAASKFAVLAGTDGELTLDELTAAMEVEKDSEDWDKSRTMDPGDTEAEGETTADVDAEIEVTEESEG